MGPLVSQSFFTQAVEFEAQISAGGSAISVADEQSLSLSYDASSDSYTLRVGSRSMTFGPADLDAGESDSQFAVYEIGNGSVTDRLTLTKPGTSGRFTYRYVGGAFWQRSDNNTDAWLNEVAVYGLPTDAAAVPRSGNASYSVDLMGYMTRRDGVEVEPMTGSGTLDVDFASGTVVTSGTYSHNVDDVIQFDGVATLSSNSNGFSGVFSFYDYEYFIGTLEGRFFGPNAEEVGAVFYAQDDAQNAAAGVLIGRANGLLGPNSDFPSATLHEFFEADVQSLSVTHNPTTNQYSNIANNNNGILVHFTPDFDAGNRLIAKYFLTSGDRTVIHTMEPQKSRFDPIDPVDWYQSEYRSSHQQKQYVTGMTWSSHTINGSIENFDFRNLVYGFPTPAQDVPVSGEAAFQLYLGGVIVDEQYEDYGFTTELSALLSYIGEGTLFADFGTGELSLDAWLEFLPGDAILSGTGTISSAANAFAGTLTAEGPHSTYTGTFDGMFYGPDVEELGGTFLASNGSDALFSGFFLGEQDPALLDARIELGDYTAPVEFHTSSVRDEHRLEGSILDWDPATGNYVFWGDFSNSELPFSITPADIVPGTENGDRIHYETDEGDRQLSGWLHNIAPGNSEIELTYASFGRFTTTYDYGGGTQVRDYFFAFGNATPDALVPRAGTASYSGIALGTGRVDAIGYDGSVHGTTTLDFNFADQSVWATLDLFTDETSPQSIGSFAYDGEVLGGDFGGNAADYPTYNGRFGGQFFGPELEEFGYAWHVNFDGGGGYNRIWGVAVGTKD